MYTQRVVELVIVLTVLIVGVFISISFLSEDVVKEDLIQEENLDSEILINIPLYYNIDYPEIIYTKDDEGNFVEVSLDE